MRKKLLSMFLAVSMLVSMCCVSGISFAQSDAASVEAKYYETITIDGEVDDAWEYAEAKDLASFNGSATTATIKTIWSGGEEESDYILNMLIEVDKNGVAVTDNDTAYVGINLLAHLNGNQDIRQVDGIFGIGAFGVSADGTATREYGWLGNYASWSMTTAANITGEDTWVAELSVVLIGSRGARSYINSEGDGFGAGTGIGISAVAFDDDTAFYSDTAKGATWDAPIDDDFVYTYRRAVISTEEIAFDVPPSTLVGDVNGDGEIDLKDATLLLKYLAGWDVEVNLVNSDANGDGELDLKDVTLVLKYLAGWDVELAPPTDPEPPVTPEEPEVDLTKVEAKYCETITVDGVVEEAWASAEARDLASFNGSGTTATIKTIWSGGADDADYVLNMLIEVDKNGVAITDNDTAYVGINLLAHLNGDQDIRQSEAPFGIGVFGVSADGIATTKYGWFGNYASDKMTVAASVTGEDTWVAELSVVLIGSRGARQYINSEGDGFGAGTGIGISAVVFDDDTAFYSDTAKGATWDAPIDDDFVYTCRRAVISTEEIVVNPA